MTAETIDRPGIGHNAPPEPTLAEQLATETAALDVRTEALAAGAGRATVTDRDSAEKATLLAGMIKDQLAAIDLAREARKRPFLEGGRAVDAHFNGLAGRLATFDPKRKLIGGPLAAVLDLVDKFRREEQARTDAERIRLEAIAQAERDKAAAAIRAQQEAGAREQQAAIDAAARVRQAEAAAAAAGDWAAEEAAAAARAEQRATDAAASERRMAAELEARRAEETAAAAQRQATAAAAPARVNTGLGVMATGRKVVIVTITDLPAALAHCLATAAPEVRALCQTILERQARAKIRGMPGCTITDDTATSIRRSA